MMKIPYTTHADKGYFKYLKRNGLIWLRYNLYIGGLNSNIPKDERRYMGYIDLYDSNGIHVICIRMDINAVYYEL